MDQNSKTAIIALIIAVLLIIAAIGIVLYEVHTVGWSFLKLPELDIPFLNRPDRTSKPPQTPEVFSPYFTPPEITAPQITIPPIQTPPVQLPRATPVPRPTPAATAVPKEPEYDSVFFGRFEQGNGPEPIEWYVLEREEDKCLLISRYGLDMLKYHGTYEAVTWETSGLRAWLNDEFLCFAFTPGEQASLLLTEVDNSVGNRIFGTDGGNNTEDRVFLLSREEAEAYFPTAGERLCRPTKALKNIAIGGCLSWWLRSPGIDASNAEYINSGGAFLHGRVDREYTAIRPVLWVSSSALE